VTGKETQESPSPEPTGGRGGEALQPALVVVWSVLEPERAGEVLLLDSESVHRPAVLGRHDPSYDYGGRPLLAPARQRPGENRPTPPLALPPYVSRSQLEIALTPDRRRIQVANCGKAALVASAQGPVPTGTTVLLSPGDTLAIADHLLLMAIERPRRLPTLRFFPPAAIPPFGAPDEHGLVGESPVIWELRDRMAFAGQLGQHALVHGPSGSGKELVARAIHRLSTRARHRMVAASAADIPPTLIEAELFGNRADYPNPGTPGREGLIGQAHQSTLFLDELGTLPIDLQAKLLRVLDEHGEYRRLGVDEAMRSDLRLVAATNRSLDQLKPDLLARLKLTIAVPGLEQRREDVPLLIPEVLARMAGREGENQIASRFIVAGGNRPRFHLDVRLADVLVRHAYRLHVRELEQLLVLAVYGSVGERIELVPALTARLDLPTPEPAVDPEAMPCEAVAEALRAHQWNMLATARALGWSRFQLNRKMKKCGLERPPAASRGRAPAPR
jgi:two-component system nitrogen regulation response regulator GlnG/two-component system response regulator HydG